MPALVAPNRLDGVMAFVAQHLAIVIDVRDRCCRELKWAEHRCECVLFVERNMLTREDEEPVFKECLTN